MKLVVVESEGLRNVSSAWQIRWPAVFIAFTLAVLAGVLVGCKSPDAGDMAARDTVEALEVSVDAAMQHWGTYVKKLYAGPVEGQRDLLRKENAVLQAYTAYRNAANVVYDKRLFWGRDGITHGQGLVEFTAAMGQASALGASLITLVEKESK